MKINLSYALSSVSARVISSGFNYLVNKKVVFSKSSSSNSLKYFALVFAQIALSAYLVYTADSCFSQVLILFHSK